MMSKWSVIFWDVGQGDATDITLPDGSHVLIDAGPLSKWGNPLVWWFARNGRPAVELAILTHSHLDHFGGFVTLCEDDGQSIRKFRFLPDAEIRKQSDERVDDLNDLLDALRIRKGRGITDVCLLQKPDVLISRDGLCLKMVYPLDISKDVAIPADVNKTSMVLVLEKESTHEPLIVWGGDNSLAHIKKSCNGLSPFILMGPHHGHPQGRHKVPEYWRFFNKCLHPHCVFVSVGREHRKLPDAHYVKGASCAGIKVCCSQLAKHCDENRTTDVYGGSGVLGLFKPKDAQGKESVQCRGAMRVYASADEGVKFDEFQESYEREIAAILPEAPCKCCRLTDNGGASERRK